MSKFVCMTYNDKKMINLFRKNIAFFAPLFAFLTISCVFIIFYPKAEIHIAINEVHSPFLDYFFKTITYLGDGMMYLFVLVFLLTQKYKWAIGFVAAVIISNIILQVCKRVVFFDMYRPSKYFEIYETYKLYLVEGVKLHNINSFPSGHTTTAFTVFFALAFVLKKHWAKALMFCIALLTGYSRMYLSQHFLQDVVVGSILGTSSVFFAFYYANKYLRKPWMQKAIFRNGDDTEDTNTPIFRRKPRVAVQ